MQRLFTEISSGELNLDSEGRIRMDDLEMSPEVQEKVSEIWNSINQENFKSCADIDGYWKDFYELFGFGVDGVDYTADVEV